ncbi:MAG: hypothetical protein Q9214_003764, partial [Letrouitia sp. 1 TL-2023]
MSPTSTITCPQTPVTNLHIQATQNTAPVLSFQCLYTHDIRRKAKRWQDGILRFHTFNKRVMVYDVPRNFVGDTHWREPQPIQDGDELELEKGVLIQVGEEMAKERAETDLTELLERGRNKNVALQGRHRQWGADGEVNVLKALTGNCAAGSKGGTNTSLRPKTLNALLGTPKGQLGRAALPTKSPAEERPNKGNEAFESERP